MAKGRNILDSPMNLRERLTSIINPQKGVDRKSVV